MTETKTMWEIIICAALFFGGAGYILRECVPHRLSVLLKIKAIQQLVPTNRELHAELDPMIADYCAQKLQVVINGAWLAQHAIEENRVPPIASLARAAAGTNLKGNQHE